jgi:hypothetical protein
LIARHEASTSAHPPSAQRTGRDAGHVVALEHAADDGAQLPSAQRIGISRGHPLRSGHASVVGAQEPFQHSTAPGHAAWIEPAELQLPTGSSAATQRPEAHRTGARAGHPLAPTQSPALAVQAPLSHRTWPAIGHGSTAVPAHVGEHLEPQRTVPGSQGRSVRHCEERATQDPSAHRSGRLAAGSSQGETHTCCGWQKLDVGTQVPSAHRTSELPHEVVDDEVADCAAAATRASHAEMVAAHTGGTVGQTGWVGVAQVSPVEHAADSDAHASAAGHRNGAAGVREQSGTPPSVSDERLLLCRGRTASWLPLLLSSLLLLEMSTSSLKRCCRRTSPPWNGTLLRSMPPLSTTEARPLARPMRRREDPAEPSIGAQSASERAHWPLAQRTGAAGRHVVGGAQAEWDCAHSPLGQRTGACAEAQAPRTGGHDPGADAQEPSAAQSTPRALVTARGHETSEGHAAGLARQEPVGHSKSAGSHRCAGSGHAVRAVPAATQVYLSQQTSWSGRHSGGDGGHADRCLTHAPSAEAHRTYPAGHATMLARGHLEACSRHE